MSTFPLRWGIIGCGNVVEVKSGPSLMLAGRSRIVAVMRRDRAMAEAYAARHQIPLATDDADQILNHPDVDIVYVATPPSTHESYVAAAARAGKHVLVEKPMAMSAAQAQRMIAACDRAGVRLFVAYYRRFYPQVRKMHELIRSGAIGQPLQAWVDVAMPAGPDTGWREVPAISGGGCFVDIASHRIDALAFLLGEVEHAAGVVANPVADAAVERLANLTIKFRSGAIAGVCGDFHTGRKADRFCIYGTGGSIVAEQLETPRLALHRGAGVETLELEAFPAPHLGLFRHIEQVFAGEAENQTSGRDALNTEKVLDMSVRRHFPWHDSPSCR